MSYNMRSSGSPGQGHMQNYGQHPQGGRGRMQGRPGQMGNHYNQIPLQQSFIPQVASSTSPAFVTQPKPQPVQQKSVEYNNQPQVKPDVESPPVKEESLPPTSGLLPTPDASGDNPTSDAGLKPWSKKKVPGFKVNRKVKRLRQNARLRRVLQPKNAIMVLNELKAGVKFVFHEQAQTLTSTPSFVASAEVDGKSHIGHGLSKPLAKQNAAENALKSLLLEKMALSAAVNHGESPMEVDTSVTTNNGAAGAEDIDDLKDDDDVRSNAPEDDVPWGSLASFALYKLFLDWQNQGSHVPIAKPVIQAANAAPPAAKTAPMKQLPENPTERHPVMLLSQMRPGVKFIEKTREGLPPNLVFTLEVTVDGVSYEGVAKNKKDAKKEAAKNALAGFLGISYP